MSKFAPIVSSQYRADDTPITDAVILEYMKNQGMPEVPLTIIYDGKRHRFPTKPSKPNDDAGWYKAEMLFGDMVIVDFGDWRSKVYGRFEKGHRKELTESQRLELEYKLEQHRIEEAAEKKRLNDERAERARQIWNVLPDATVDNEYLKRKKVLPHGTRITKDGSLVVPLYNESGEIRSLQFIPSGEGSKKQYLWGTEVGNCFWWLGDTEKTKVFLCEGFATGASIYETTGATVFIAFSASSLPKTSKILQKHGKDVTIVADNDSAGRDWAKEAEGCHVFVIPIEKMDANDYQNAKGNLSDILPNLEVESKMLMVEDILSTKLVQSWLIKGWIPSESIGMIHGPSASGKTTIMLDMILSATSIKGQWHDISISKPIKVVYLCGEGLNGVKARIKAWSAYHMTNVLGCFAAYPLPLDLDTPAGIHEIREQINTLPWKPDLIVIDTVNRYMSGDENSAQDTRIFLNCVDAFRKEYCCSGLYVHHIGNNEDAKKRARGSSAWRGALDYEISVDIEEQTNLRKIEQVKMKDSELKSPLYGHLESVTIPGEFNEDGDPISSVVFETDDAPKSETDRKLDEYVNQLFLIYTQTQSINRHISKEKWIEWLLNNGKVKNRKAAQDYLSDQRDNRMVGKLLKEGVITKEGEGFYIHDTPATHLSLSLMEAGK